MKTSERVTIAWIDPGLVDGAFAMCIAQVYLSRADRIAGLMRVEGGLISRQRNEVVRGFLDSDTGADWLLMIDSDEQLSIEAFDKIISVAHAIDRPVVSGLYFGTLPNRGLIPQPIPHLYRQVGDGMHYSPIVDYPDDRVIEIDAAGTGALLVHRRVLEAIRDTADEYEGRDWCWFRDLPIAGEWVGEDIYFCRRIKSLGFPIVAHTGAILPHRRRYWLDERQHERIREVSRV